MKRKLLTGALAAAMALSCLSSAAFAEDIPDNVVIAPNPVISPAPVTFTDLDAEHWAYADAARMVSLGYMDAEEGAFAPMQVFTRGEFITVLWRMSGKPAGEAELSFTDVAAEGEQADAIRWAAAEGLVKGTGDGTTFSPNGTLTREMLSTMIYRYVQHFGMGFRGMWYFLLDFEDASQISEWADEPMHWMVSSQILKGVSETEIAPKGTVTRAEGAVMLSRLLGVAEKDEIDFTQYAAFEVKPEEQPAEPEVKPEEQPEAEQPAEDEAKPEEQPAEGEADKAADAE